MYAGGYSSGDENKQNKAILLKTCQELKNYYKENKDKYGFDFDKPCEQTYSIKNFRDKITNYNDNWFKEHDLVIIVSTEGSGSYFYRLKNQRFILKKVEIILLRDAHGYAVNCAMAGWHTFVEIEKKSTTLAAEVSIVNK